jgi:hypothetical protein
VLLISTRTTRAQQTVNKIQLKAQLTRHNGMEKRKKKTNKQNNTETSTNVMKKERLPKALSFNLSQKRVLL